MRRVRFAALALLGAISFLATQHLRARPLDAPQVRSTLSAELAIENGTGPHRSVVNGEKCLPLRLLCMDVGDNWPFDRRLVAFVVVYTTKPGGPAAADKIVTTWTSPEPLLTLANQSNFAEIATDIPLDSGRYRCEVYLCDPDTPVGVSWEHNSYQPPLSDYPGYVRKMHSVVLTVK